MLIRKRKIVMLVIFASTDFLTVYVWSNEHDFEKSYASFQMHAKF